MPQDQPEQDAAMAAADLYKKLQSGFYRTKEQKRCRINGDTSKLRFAEGITDKQKRLLADFRFRTETLAGTQEIRTGIGQVCFWGSVVYGNGIFMTVSPGGRHNYLAVRLSRYRSRDPYVTHALTMDANKYIGKDHPSLEAKENDRFHFEVQGYDLRRLLQARDPLAPALDFGVQIRTQVAPIFGIRMCPECPHSAEYDAPCQDSFGSNAEAMGGAAGRSGIGCAVQSSATNQAAHCTFTFGIYPKGPPASYPR